MLRLAFDFIITWRETRTRPNAYFLFWFYGINSLRPASGSFLYLVSKGCSAGCARNDNSVSFHHAMFAHQCRNSEKYGITNSLK